MTTRRKDEYKKEGHIRSFCLERTQKKDELAQSDKGDASNASDGSQQEVVSGLHRN